MKLKEKLIGIILIVLGALPFLLKIERIGTTFSTNKILSYIAPGDWIYQIIIIILGISLVLTLRHRIESS